MHIDVPISGETIKLGQFLKLANLVESGGHAKEAIVGGEVTVNNEVITARGHSLIDGDTVGLGPDSATVVVDGDGGDYFDERTANDDFDPEKWRNM